MKRTTGLSNKKTMKMNVFPFLKTLLLSWIVLCLVGCALKKETGTLLPLNRQKEYQELIAQANAYFATMHLTGWRKAEAFYDRAYALKKTTALRDKRFLTLYLIAIREKHEGIVGTEVFEKIAELANFPMNKKQRYLFDMIGDYRLHYRPTASEKKVTVDITSFDIENSSLDAYLYLYCLKHYSFDYQANNKELMEFMAKHQLFRLLKKYSDTPLFIYLDYRSQYGRREEIENQFPQFAEFFVGMGNLALFNKKPGEAWKYFKKALRLIPEYTQALNGIGNIFFLHINDYETAVNYYDNALALDPINPTALFGKGASCHYLKQYNLSNQVFDILLQNHSLHRGEAFYFKACNFFLMDRLTQARDMIREAKSYLPLSGEVHFLSGSIYRKESKLPEAEADFLKSLEDAQYSKCRAYYQLGLIHHEMKKDSFINYFLFTCNCLEFNLQNEREKLKTIDAMEIPDEQKQWMKNKWSSELAESIDSSQKMIEQVMSILKQAPGNGQTQFMEELGRLLARVRSGEAGDAAAGPASDDDGQTPLHQAVSGGKPLDVELQISRGAAMDRKDKRGYTPLHWAVLLGKKEIVELLIKNGAGIDSGNQNGWTPLHDAVYGKHKEIARLLIEKGANVYAENHDGRMPPDLVVPGKSQEWRDLLEPLHAAAQRGELERLQSLLMKYPAAIDVKDEMGWTPLHAGVQNGHADIVRFLIAQGADVNARGNKGRTPLHMAIQHQQKEISALLQEKGALDESDEKLLERKLEEKQAVIWYLHHRGWAIKTKNHLVILGYEPAADLGSSAAPQPCLASGQIDPLEIKGQSVVLVSNAGGNEDEVQAVSKWKKTISNMTCIMPLVSRGNTDNQNPDWLGIAPGEKKKIGQMEITILNASASHPGYLVKVDGLTILHTESEENGEGQWEGFARDIDEQGENDEKIDVVFLSFYEGFRENKENVYKNVFSALEKLEVKELFLGDSRGNNIDYNEFVAALSRHRFKAKKKIATKVHKIRSGDRFLFPADSTKT